MTRRCLLSTVICHLFFQSLAQNIPLPEHPRPDFYRDQWQNLNGIWNFTFDSTPLDEINIQNLNFEHKIQVPFPWGSSLSQVDDQGDIGWYHRNITIGSNWTGKRIYITVGAADWHTTIWLDGQLVGSHKGGYTPFSFDLTTLSKPGQEQSLLIRVDDTRRDFTLYGKQGYGNARGIWQTLYLEARGETFMDAVHFSPNIDESKVEATIYLSESTNDTLPLTISFDNTEVRPIETFLEAGKRKHTVVIEVPKQRLWSLDDPYLYETTISLGQDVVHSYFGMRKISVKKLPGTEYPYVALNNEPVYLQMALDQSYHPEGFYTFPSDQFMRQEIERSKSIGLNGIRTHVKIDIPRKLYWADKLGLLVMADVPNSWGEPDSYMQADVEYAMRQMIKRDYNHPSIFSWIIFNETWGLYTNVEGKSDTHRTYLPTTQQWVASMYHLAKSLDHTRLVEDNSICCGRGHTITDINSWHAYLPGYKWPKHLDSIVRHTYVGSTFDYEDGWKQTGAPNINSECGNVWGYKGSTGDIDWSYDYHRMMNTFRMFPQIAGWLYTEHHDVINEWNGYWKFDRSNKHHGLEELMPGMTLKDLHAPVYISLGNDICLVAKTRTHVSLPVYLSSHSAKYPAGTYYLKYNLGFTNTLGEYNITDSQQGIIDYQPWMQSALDSLRIVMPDESGLMVVQIQFIDANGLIMHRNFCHIVVTGGSANANLLGTLSPDEYSESEWSEKQWTIMGGQKVNGAGKGYFSYIFPVDKNDRHRDVEFRAELGAKKLHVKDQEAFNRDQDYMKGSRVSPSGNPNSYPMTDDQTFPSEIEILAEGRLIHSEVLPDDPADHRGILSWHSQAKDGFLHEAGSYGYLVRAKIPRHIWRMARQKGKIEIKINCVNGGGIAVYGNDYGRYPVEPSLVRF